MNIAFYSGVSGMVAYQQEMDVLANNIANVGTTGFKPSKASFSDLLYTKMDINAEEKPLTGHGVKVADTQLRYKQGTPNATNNGLDFALLGEGFFAVERDGKTEYTRNGAFDVSMEGKKGYLVTTDGAYVLDAKGKQIDLKQLPNSNLYDLEGIADRLGVYTFSNPYGLQPTSGSSFLETENSGTATAVKNNKKDLPYQLLTQTLESSAVDLSEEMVNMIMTQKAFQFNAKIVQTADEIEEVVNNLR
ncbi:flagellar hook-basal body protein [Oscillospiraceae bacterium PP1C4]